MKYLDTFFLMLVAIATVITVILTKWQSKAQRENRSDDFERTFSIKNVNVSEYRESSKEKYIISIEMTNDNNIKPLGVNGVVLDFENGEQITALIDEQVQRNFHIKPKERGKLEVSIIDVKVKNLKGKEATLTVKDTDEKTASEKFLLNRGKYFFQYKNKG